ncbi:MAG: thioredoxin family protein [Bacteroidota bacterium]|jgi:thioredoxin-related protein
MFDKRDFAFTIITILAMVLMFSFTRLKVEHGPVNWISFGEAVEKCKLKPKMILIDVYTTWCGPCKMLSANTFANEKIAKYLNENYYCVKFDAETRELVKFTMPIQDTIRDSKGKIKKITTKPYEYVFPNQTPQGTPRGTHSFAVSILQGYQIAYPSIVFISKEIQRANVVQGYLPPQQFEPIMKFYGSDSWKKQTWEDFQRSFKSEF